MDQPTQRFPANTRVRLREGVDPGFYGGYSRVGSEGWVRRRKKDKYGYPQVLIEWDKDHWAYNGQEDCWTWEGHFEAVDETQETQMPEQDDKPQPTSDDEFKAHIQAIAEKFVTNVYGAIAEHRGETPPTEEPEAEAEEDTEEKSDGKPTEEDWEALLGEAMKSLGSTPAYVVIALERLSPEGAPTMIVPRVFHASREPEYALIVQSQLANVLAGFTEQTVQRILQQRSSHGDT